MTWKRDGEYAIRAGPWIVSKAYVMGKARYLPWHGDKVHSGPYDTAEEAKGERDERSKREQGR